MKPQLLILVMLTFCFSISYGQITFQKTYGTQTWQETGNCVQQTSDGYVICGSSQASLSNASLIKTDFMGNVLCEKEFDAALLDVAWFVQQASDGGYILAGTKGTTTTSDIYIVKTDSNCNVLWSKNYGGTDIDDGYSICETSDGGYVITGGSRSFGIGSSDIYLIKINNAGNLLWTKTYGDLNFGEFGSSVQETTDGGFIITGGYFGLALLKTDSAGNLLWLKSYYTANGGEAGNAVQQTSDGGYIVAGETQSSGVGNRDIYLVKTDSIGNLLWSKSFGGTGTDYGKFVVQTTDGGYMVTGRMDIGSFKAFLIKTDAFGNLTWIKTYGNIYITEGNCVQKTIDGGYIVAGTINIAGANDLYLVKTDSNGNSGCYDTTITTTVTTPTTLDTNTAPVVSTGGSANIQTTSVISTATVTTLCLLTEIDELRNDAKYFLLYPNPALTNFKITSTQSEINTVEIYNTLGQKLFLENGLNTFEITVDISKWDVGIYFVRVNKGEKQFSMKLIVQHD